MVLADYFYQKDRAWYVLSCLSAREKTEVGATRRVAPMVNQKAAHVSGLFCRM